MRTLLKTKLLAVAIVATFVLLGSVTAVLADVSATPGGTVYIGNDEIASIVANQGTLVAATAQYELTDMLANLNPVVIKPAVGGLTYLTLDPVTGTLIPDAQAGAGMLNYTVELYPYPAVTPYLSDPNNIGVDVTLPNQARIHIYNAENAAMMVKQGVTDTGQQIQDRAGPTIGIIQQAVGNYLVLSMGDATNVADVAQSAVTAIQTGSWNNTHVETCVAASSEGKTVVIGVPPGTIGGWTPTQPYNQCPAQPVQQNATS